MNKKSILTLAIALVVVVSVAQSASAYVLLSPTRTWASAPVNVPVYQVGNSSIADTATIAVRNFFTVHLLLGAPFRPHRDATPTIQSMRGRVPRERGAADLQAVPHPHRPRMPPARGGGASVTMRSDCRLRPAEQTA